MKRKLRFFKAVVIKVCAIFALVTVALNANAQRNKSKHFGNRTNIQVQHNPSCLWLHKKYRNVIVYHFRDSRNCNFETTPSDFPHKG